MRRFLKNQLYVLVFAILHGLFSLYIRIRQAYHIVSYQISSVLYYHHGTPEYIRRDVEGLGRKPKHLSAILKAEENQRPKADLDRLIEETAELAAWCASAEIPMLSIYEKTGARFSSRWNTFAYNKLMPYNRYLEEAHAPSLRSCHAKIHLLLRRSTS